MLGAQNRSGGTSGGWKRLFETLSQHVSGCLTALLVGYWGLMLCWILLSVGKGVDFRSLLG